MDAQQAADPLPEPILKPSPSLRRVLAGYLQLRSPYNLCLDAGLVILVSYLGTYLRHWADDTSGVSRPTEQFSLWWAVHTVVAIAVSMIYYSGFGLFAIGCVRIIADRIGPPPPRRP